MKRTFALLSFAAVLAVAAFAHTSPLHAKAIYCSDCCKGDCGKTCCQNGCTDSCCESK